MSVIGIISQYNQMHKVRDIITLTPPPLGASNGIRQLQLATIKRTVSTTIKPKKEWSWRECPVVYTNMLLWAAIRLLYSSVGGRHYTMETR